MNLAGGEADAFRWLFGFVRPHGARLAAVLGLSIAASGLVLLQPYLTKLIIDDGLLAKDVAALVFYARMINLETGDRIRMRLTGPSGVVAETELEPLARTKAHYVAFAGRKRRGPRWGAGRYEGTVQVLRAGKVVLGGRARLVLR